ncbi:MAG TPA: YihY family inner membrane protein [Burkholderiales bacterium]|nr:YihY family inner membrane protein [Burkholderiales bacterium]
MDRDLARNILDRLPHFVREVLARFRQDRCLQLASSLTFTTLLAMVPLVTVSLMLLSAFPAALTPKVNDVLASRVLPEAVGRAIQTYFEQFSLRSMKLTAIGSLLLIGSAIINMMTIERAFNTIWRVRHPRPTAQRVMVYWAVLTLGPVLIGASLTMTSYLVSASLGLARGAPLVGQAILSLAPVVLTVAAFTLLYSVVPARRVSRRHALIGGVVAGLLFEAAKRSFALYVMRSPSYTMAYGAFAAVPVFLLWIYLSWLVAALGAVVVATLPDYWVLPVARSRVPGVYYRDALDVLVAMTRARHRGEGLDVYGIARGAGLPVARTENLLETLRGHDWAGQLEDGRWVLVRDPAVLRLAEICKRLALSAEELVADRADSALARSFTDLSQGIDSALAMTLAEVSMHTERHAAPPAQRIKLAHPPSNAGD